MKVNINWKGTLIVLSILILFVGTFRYAIGDITFPNTFVPGTAAIASQVNANFNAINTRQTASAAAMAGTYYIRSMRSDGSYTTIHYDPGVPNGNTINIPVQTACVRLKQGTVTLSSDGNVSASTSQINQCNDGTPPSTTTSSGMGSFLVNADGTGTITIGSETLTFITSKDLKTFVYNYIDPPKLEHGIAIRQ